MADGTPVPTTGTQGTTVKMPMPTALQVDVDALSKLNLLIYGAPGTGKTVFSASAEDVLKAQDVLFIDLDTGTMSIRERLKSSKHLRLARPTTWDELKEVINWYVLDDAAKKIHTIVIDSLTEVVKLATAGVIKEDMAKNVGRDQDLSTLQDWQRTILRVSRMVQLLRDTEANVIVTAWVNELKDDLTGAVMKKPALPGKLADEVPGYFDVVGYLYVDEVDKKPVRRLRTQPSYNTIAKDRSNILQPIVDNPTFASLYDAIFAK